MGFFSQKPFARPFTRIKRIATFLVFSFLTGRVPFLVVGGVLYRTFL